MATVSLLSPTSGQRACGNLSACCFPFISDPERRSPLLLKAAMVLLHVIFVGVFVAMDADHLIRQTRERPWYTAFYLLLLVASLVQFFFTSGSSPGYVVDAMKAWREENATATTTLGVLKQSAPRNGNAASFPDLNRLGSSNTKMNLSSWLKYVMDLYPPGSSTRSWSCNECNIVQPPRSKHCYDCEKCILRFDHHCVWLGTCIGQGNHCRFWWYLLVETILCVWTGTLYVIFLRLDLHKSWWKDATVISLLAMLLPCLIFLILLLLFHSYLALTGQTTYELARRRRILYLRGIPRSVNPFSKGIRRNLYRFCCSRGGVYDLEAVPAMDELQSRARPYMLMDLISCRCC